MGRHRSVLAPPAVRADTGHWMPPTHLDSERFLFLKTIFHVHTDYSVAMGGHTTDEHQQTPLEAVDAHIDSGPGSGAFSPTEDWVRGHSRPEEHDGRAPTRTYFSARDADDHYPPWQHGRDKDDKRSWRTLEGWQDGVQSDISRGGQNWWADKQRWVDTFGDILGATDYQEQEAKRVLEALSTTRPGTDNTRMTTYQSARVPTEGIIVGILSLLIDADIVDFEHRTLARSGVRDLLTDLEMEVSDYEHIRSMLRQKDADIIFPP